MKDITVLVAEDDLTSQKLFQRFLETQGIRVITAGNGKEALDLYNKQDIHCILMDIHLPLMDGIDVTKKIRETENKSGSHVTIISMSADPLTRDAEAAGFDASLQKPVALNLLLETIKKSIEI